MYASKALEYGFKKAFNEIDLIQAKIPQKKGIWIFKLHKYTVDELLKSEHHAKIYSITEKLGDDIGNWHSSGKLNNRDFDFYHGQRDVLENRLQVVHLEVLKRQPTWLEELVGLLNDFVKFVMINLPQLRRYLPSRLSTTLWFLPSGNPLKMLIGNSDE